ncbi:dephospho-CoA kinase [Winogradskyella sp. E313]|uniref:Dephospho-CoA kinase n=1 Tax=Winogradskyella immobilis TaxID=2816852 RepID=A0ABS8ENL0_9FLAO|nr:dephospho-CoA kinase [Winogradskyella immobilis]
MKVVGITGGIGSGKTTIARVFNAIGIPVYYADDEAKALMNRSKVIRRKLIELFGDEAYENEKLNRAYLRTQIFNNRTLLSKMNAIVHPKVGSHFQRWLKRQKTAYVLKEAAIIFENNLENQYDYIITVIADENSRIERVINRDGITKPEVKAILKNQLPDDKKVKHSDFVIINNDLPEAKIQAYKIHQQILKKIR